MSLLEVEELRTGYGSLPVLQGISFSVEEGETAVIFEGVRLGPNWSRSCG